MPEFAPGSIGSAYTYSGPLSKGRESEHHFWGFPQVILSWSQSVPNNFELFFLLHVYFPKTVAAPCTFYKKFVLQSSCFLFRGMVRKGIWESLLLFLFHETEFRVVFSSAERFGRECREFASIFVPRTEFGVVFSFPVGFGREFREFASIFFSTERNGIPSCFLFHGSVRNGIPRVSVPRNSRNSVGNNHLFRLFRLPRNYFFVGNSQPYAVYTYRTFFSETIISCRRQTDIGSRAYSPVYSSFHSR